MALDVRPISVDQHLAFVATLPSVSFLQLPSWGKVKAEWANTSIGWFNGEELIGVGLVLMRKVPKMDRYLAYLPEGPVLDWDAARTGLPINAWLQPMLAYLKDRGAFAVKMGPPVTVREWHAATIKDAIAAGVAKRLGQVPADSTTRSGQQLTDQLQAAGWTQRPDAGAGFGDIQPRYVYQVPLAGRTEDELFAGFNQLWRRNIRKAEKLGVTVERGTRDDLALFHPIYVETAARDGFVPRGLDYFERMWDAMNGEDPDRLRLYLARHEGQILAATTVVTVGNHTWYSYGASANVGREVRPSNAIQWQMIRDARDEGRAVYDLRGISDTLDEDDPLFGLIRFKLGTGGDASEYVGEWDYALRPTLAKAFDLYMRRADIKKRLKGTIARNGSRTIAQSQPDKVPSS